MTDDDGEISDRRFVGRVTASAIQLSVLAAWVALCVHFVLPFFFPVLWGAILATAVYPLVKLVVPGKPKLGALLFLVTALAVVLIPTWFLFRSALDALASIGHQLAQGELRMPKPDPRVAEWPLIGGRVHQMWTEAFETPSELAQRLSPQLRSVGRFLIASAGEFVSAIGLSLVSVLLATFFLARADQTSRGLVRVAERLLPGRGADYVTLAGATVRSVAQGVLGLAFLQGLLAALALVLAHVPGAGLWSALVLIVAVMQLPPLLVLGPLSIYVFGAQGNLTGGLFLAWAILVSASDGLLKPFLLGRGVSVPTLVIVLGAIGGLITNGFIGLFVGAVVLAVAHELGRAWLGEDKAKRQEPTIPTVDLGESSPPAPLAVERPAHHH